MTTREVAVSTTVQRVKLEESASRLIYRLLNQATSVPTLDHALRAFAEKLPHNQGAQLCVEEVVGMVRRIARSALSKSQQIARVTHELERPGFVEYLAGFGKLPNHPYILVFDPYAYQIATPPPPPPTTARSGGTGADSTIKELESLDKELQAVYDEAHRPSGLRCSGCKDPRFVSVRTLQRRSADEGSGYLYHCAKCNHVGYSR
jgi:hypothetical protein